MQEKTIAIYGREFNASVLPYVEQLFTYLRENNVQVYVHSDFYNFLKKTSGMPQQLATLL